MREFLTSITLKNGAVTGLEFDSLADDDLPRAGTPGTAAFATVTVDQFGRVTGLSGGTPPVYAPTSSQYVLTATDANLTGAKVIPHLANYDPDVPPASPSSQDDEFAADALSGSWTSLGPPTTLSAATFHGFALMADASAAEAGIFEAYAPGAVALTVVCKLSFAVGSGFSYAGLYLADSSGTALATLTLQNDNAGAVRARTGPTGGTNVSLTGVSVTDVLYLRIQRDGGTAYLCHFSRDGKLWVQVQGFSQAGTVGRIYLVVNGQGGTAAGAAFDFVRTFTSKTDSVGRAP